MTEYLSVEDLEFLMGAEVKFEVNPQQLAGVHLFPGEELRIYIPIILTGQKR